MATPVEAVGGETKQDTSGVVSKGSEMIPVSIKGVKTSICYNAETLVVEIKDRAMGGAKKKKSGAPDMSVPLVRVLNIGLPARAMSEDSCEREAAKAEEGAQVGGSGCFGGAVQEKDLVESAQDTKTKDAPTPTEASPITPATTVGGEKESWTSQRYSITFLMANAKPKDLASQVRVLRLTPLCAAGADALHRLFVSLEAMVYPDGPLTVTSFVSPASGSGKAVKLWESIALPLLKHSRHKVKTIETTRRYHAHDYCADPANNFDPVTDVVVAAGGDGMLFEVVNGFKMRHYNQGKKYVPPPPMADGAEEGAVPHGAEGYDFSTVGDGDSIPRIANFACGSGCAMAAGLDVISHIDGALAIIHAHSVYSDLLRGVPVSTMRNPTAEEIKKAKKEKKDAPQPTLVTPDYDAEPPTWAFLSFISGFIAAIDRESEKWRWMGNARFTVYAVSSIVSSVPNYECTIKYQPWTFETSCYQDPVAAKKLLGDHDWGELADVAPQSLKAPGILCRMDNSCPCQTMPRKAAVGPAAAAATAGGDDARDESAPAPTAGGGDGEWKTIDSTKFVVNTLNATPYLAQDMIFAPFVHISGGMIDIALADGNKNPGRGTVLSGIVEAEAGTQMLAKKDPKEQAKNAMRTIRARRALVQPHEGLIGADGEYFPFRGYLVDPQPNAVRFVRTRLAKGHHWPAAHKK